VELEGPSVVYNFMQESAWAVWKRLAAGVVFESPDGIHMPSSRPHRLGSEPVSTIRSGIFRTENALVIFPSLYLQVLVTSEEEIPVSVSNSTQLDVWSITFDWRLVESCGWSRSNGKHELHRTASKSDWSTASQSGGSSEVILREVYARRSHWIFTSGRIVRHRIGSMRAIVTKKSIQHVILRSYWWFSQVSSFGPRTRNDPRSIVHMGAWRCWVVSPSLFSIS
jgi:hypothetical protein